MIDLRLRKRKLSKLNPGEQRAYTHTHIGSVTQHAELKSKSVYLASLSCLAMIMRMVTRATITVVVRGISTARARVHPSGVAGLVVGATSSLHEVNCISIEKQY